MTWAAAMEHTPAQASAITAAISRREARTGAMLLHTMATANGVQTKDPMSDFKRLAASLQEDGTAG